jgi:CheY-like chemotaxis protein
LVIRCHKGFMETSTQRRVTVLVVEDDDAVARVTRRQLLYLGCDVVLAANAGEALRALECIVFDAVVTDYDLGEATTGLDLLARVARERPEIGRVLYSGAGRTPENVAVQVALNKPACAHELRRALARVSRLGAEHGNATRP